MFWMAHAVGGVEIETATTTATGPKAPTGSGPRTRCGPQSLRSLRPLLRPGSLSRSPLSVPPGVVSSISAAYLDTADVAGYELWNEGFFRTLLIRDSRSFHEPQVSLLLAQHPRLRISIVLINLPTMSSGFGCENPDMFELLYEIE